MVKNVRRYVASTAQELTTPVTTQMGHVTKAVSRAIKDVSARKVGWKSHHSNTGILITFFLVFNEFRIVLM